MSQKNLSRAEAAKVLVISRGITDLKKKQLNEEEAIEHLTTMIHAKVKEHLTAPTPAVSKKPPFGNDSKIRAMGVQESVAVSIERSNIKTGISNMDGVKGAARLPTNKPVKSCSVKQVKAMKNLRKRHHMLTSTEDVSSPLEKKAAAVDPAAKKEQPNLKARSISPSPAVGGRKRSQQQSQQLPHSSSKRTRTV